MGSPSNRWNLTNGEIEMMLGRSSSEKTRTSGSSSFLVRLSREAGRDTGAVRVYLRNLQTGEELYLGDPKRVGEVLGFAAGRSDGED